MNQRSWLWIPSPEFKTDSTSVVCYHIPHVSLSAQSPDASKCEVSKKTVRKVTISWLQEQLSLGLLKLRSIVAQIGGMFQTKREPPRLTSPKLSTSTTMKWSWSILLIKAICRVKDQWGDSQTCAFPMNTAVHRSFKNFICSYYIFVLSLSLSINLPLRGPHERIGVSFCRIQPWCATRWQNL